ncbi:hypothetical protein [Bradyrhizobium sp. TM233]|uniref:hypothetical protein n=1 Tax=Bradyrhizobium sp. TM233 TaxID=2599801 RepID=UPI0027D680F1|nr:hypothetical protein TM233_58860 [Bradyrhizobium sp. TM233]
MTKSVSELQTSLLAAKVRYNELSRAVSCLDFREVAELRSLGVMLPIMTEEIERAREEQRKRAAACRFGGMMTSDSESIWMKDATGLMVSGPRMIHGIASTPTPSIHYREVDGERKEFTQVLLSRGANIKLPVPMWCAHCGDAAIGQFVFARKRADQIYVIGMVFENEASDYAWSKILSGEMRCLSVGSRNGRSQGVIDGRRFWDCWDLKEISICREGANPDAKFEIYNGVCRPRQATASRAARPSSVSSRSPVPYARKVIT